MRLESEETLVLTRADVARVLRLEDCIAAVEEAHRLHAKGKSWPPGVLSFRAKSGAIHIKAGGLELSRTYFVAKVNGNFFENQKRYGLPNIQGVILLMDGENGAPLAVMDSIEITIQRTGATSAVAAKYLARKDASVVTIAGCGNQGRSHLRALSRVRVLSKVFAHDVDGAAAERLAGELSPELGIEVIPVRDLPSAVRESQICVTATPSRSFFLRREDVAPGTFLAAVGADNPEKQEVEPLLLAEAKVVVDHLEQCTTLGELHHAIDSGLVTRDDVYAELAEIVAGLKPGRTTEDEVIVFDSTGTALQDAAAAAVVYERARAVGAGARFRFW